MIALVLIGCEPISETDATDHEEPLIDNGVEEIELVLWTGTPLYNKACEKAIADFEDAHPGVTIKHLNFESTWSYKDDIFAAWSEVDFPDVFYCDQRFFETFVSSGKALPLEDYYTDEYKSQISDVALTYAKYDDKLYGVTFDTSISLLFYNNKIFLENGVKPPTTFDELIDV